MQRWIDRFFEWREARRARDQTTCYACRGELVAAPVLSLGHRFCTEDCALEHWTNVTA